MKNKPAMPIPRTSYQNQQKVFMQNATQRWRALSDTNRNAWITYATTYPTPTRLNPDAYLNGFNLFVKFNALMLLTGQPVRETISLTQSLLTPTDVYIAWDGVNYYIGFEQSSMGGTWRTIAFISPRIQGYTTARTTKTRFVNSWNATPGNQIVNVTTQYPARFSEQLVVGSQYYVDMTWLNSVSGQIIEWPTSVVTVLDES